MPGKYTSIGAWLEGVHKYTGLLLLIISGGKKKAEIFNLLSSESAKFERWLK